MLEEIRVQKKVITNYKGLDYFMILKKQIKY